MELEKQTTEENCMLRDIIKDKEKHIEALIERMKDLEKEIEELKKELCSMLSKKITQDFANIVD